jgi:hypothetical protein
MSIIEYECEEGIFLQFYFKAYLEATPISRNSVMRFIVRPDQVADTFWPGSFNLLLQIAKGIRVEKVRQSNTQPVAYLFNGYDTGILRFIIQYAFDRRLGYCRTIA